VMKELISPYVEAFFKVPVLFLLAQKSFREKDSSSDYDSIFFIFLINFANLLSKQFSLPDFCNTLMKCQKIESSTQIDLA